MNTPESLLAQVEIAESPEIILKAITNCNLSPIEKDKIISALVKKFDVKKGVLLQELKFYQKEVVYSKPIPTEDATGYCYPEGFFYDSDDGWLKQRTPLGDQKIYHGDIRVIGIEKNYHTGEYYLVIEFTHNSRKRTLTARNQKLATGKGVIEELTSNGASVSESSSKTIASFVIDSYRENEERLSSTIFSEKLGVCGEKGLVLHGKSVATEVQYRGQYATAGGWDLNPMKTALREIGQWDSWVIPFFLGASLFSPFMGRMKSQIQRNPIFCLIGESGYGKSTALHFANSVWGNPLGQPHKVERPSYVGYIQTVTQLGSLPIHLDEIHTGKPHEVENIFYSYANRIAKTYGSKDYRAPKGGESIHGIMMASGEYVPQLTEKGAYNRIIPIRVEDFNPLGVVPKTKPLQKIGIKRAKFLEDAWFCGNGLLGPQAFEYFNAHWDEIRLEILELSQDAQFSPFDSNWRMVLAAIRVMTSYLYSEVLNLPPPSYFMENYVTDMTAICENKGSDEGDPANDAWERVATMIATSNIETENDIVIYKVSNVTVGWQSIGSNGVQIVIPKDTEPFRRALGNRGLASYAKSWIDREYIIPSGENKRPTSPRSRPDIRSGKCHCIVTTKLNSD